MEILDAMRHILGVKHLAHHCEIEHIYAIRRGCPPLKAILLWASASTALQGFSPFISRIHLMVYLLSMLYPWSIRIYVQSVGRGDGEPHCGSRDAFDCAGCIG
jgi:hypothetical protein